LYAVVIFRKVKMRMGNKSEKNIFINLLSALLIACTYNYITDKCVI